MKLSAVNVDSKSLFFSWFYAAQRDFTYVSMAGSYTPLTLILRDTFKRACRIVDLPPDQVSEDDVAAVMEVLTRLPPRRGLKACYDGLALLGWNIYVVTNGGKQTTLDYYKLAGVGLDDGHVLSCDDIRAAKPDTRVYTTINEYLTACSKSGEGAGERWFVAAHAWDLIAARKAGFKTAYLDFEEHDPVTQVFGEFDLYASSMEELLAKLQTL